MLIKLELPTNKEELAKMVSNYNPDRATKERTQQVMKHYQHGWDLMQSPYEEFNDRTVIDYQNDSQKAFNSYVPPASDDPDEAWRANTIRPITRNKVVSMAAHLTASTLFPKVFAQNKNDKEDKEAASVMRDLMEWAGDQSNYSQKFLYTVIAMLVNPAAIIHTEYRQVMRTMKEIQEDGSWTEKEMVDELVSGFQNNIVPIDELYISNVYEHDIQKQPFLIWRRIIDFDIAYYKYGDNEKFKEYVKPGIQHVFTEEDDTFYEQYDEELTDNLVEEVIYYNQLEDLELIYVNGVLLDHPEQPLRRQDKKYPFAKTGFELIDEGRFFYYRSLVDKLADDQNIADVMWNMILDGTFMQLMPPTAVFGEEDVDASVVVPGTVTRFKADTKLQSINPVQNFNAAYNALEKIEANFAESSQSAMASGVPSTGIETAFETARVEQNARTVLGLSGKMVGFFVKEWGELMVGNILQFLTIGEVMELTSPNNALKFRNFVLPEKEEAGKKVGHRIEFDDNSGYGDKLEESLKLLEQQEKEGDVKITKVNPKLFRELKYLIRVNPDFKAPESEAVKKAFNLEAYDRAIQNPVLDPEKVTREFLLSSYDQSKDSPDDFVMRKTENQDILAQAAKAAGGASGVIGQATPETDLATVMGGRANANTVV